MAPAEHPEFESWFRDHSATVWRYAARRLGPASADDITAATFAAAWSSIDRFDGSLGSPAGWLLGIATNLIRRQQRSEARQLRAYARTGVDPVDDAICDATDRLDASDRWPLMAAALAELRHEDRELFWLQVTTELSYAEMATITGVAVGTVRSRLARTRERLRVAVGEPARSGPRFSRARRAKQ